MSESEPDLFTVKAAAKRELGSYQGVQGFGVGAGTVRVYVRDEVAAACLPTEFQGVPLEVVVAGDITPLDRDR